MDYQRAAINAETPRRTHSRGTDGRYSVEASEMRLPVGQWPINLTLPTAEYGVVTFKRYPYGRDEYSLPDVERDADGDIVAVHYYGPMGIHLVVWND
jgi:hypothetical protein